MNQIIRILVGLAFCVPGRGDEIPTLRPTSASFTVESDADIQRVCTEHPYVSELTVDGAHLSVASLKGLSRLRNLETLSINSPSLKSEDIREILQRPLLDSLRSLTVKTEDLDSPLLSSPLKAEILNNISLCCRTISADALASIAACPNLSSLTLEKCSLGLLHINEINKAKFLMKLDLRRSECEVHALKEMANFAFLEEIAIPGYLGEDEATITYLSQCTTLKVISTTLNVTDETIEKLQKMPNLCSVSVSGKKVSEKGWLALARNSTLEELLISDGTFSTDALFTILQMRGLHKLHVYRGSVRRTDQVKVRDTRIKELAYYGVDLPPDVVKDMILACPLLDSMVLECKSVSDEALLGIDTLSYLKTLVLTGTTVTDEGLGTIAKCRRLQQLNILGTRITEEGLFKLQKITTLRFLSQGKATAESDVFRALKKALPNLSSGPMF